MRLLIESTDEVTHIRGVPCRVWEGSTERGAACKVFVHLIAADPSAGDVSDFERELREMPDPRVLPLHMVL